MTIQLYGWYFVFLGTLYTNNTIFLRTIRVVTPRNLSGVPATSAEVDFISGLALAAKVVQIDSFLGQSFFVYGIVTQDPLFKNSQKSFS
jgi:hypothetical protein